MEFTPNFNLKKPELNDPVDIDDLNDNADIIDAALATIPSPSAGELTTVFLLMGA